MQTNYLFVMASILVYLGGMILLGMGILGEYIGKIFNEVKGRPGYFINSYNGERNTINRI